MMVCTLNLGTDCHYPVCNQRGHLIEKYNRLKFGFMKSVKTYSRLEFRFALGEI